MIEKVLDLPEGFLTDYQPKSQPSVARKLLNAAANALGFGKQ
jgi:hypothetical protein